MGVLRRGGNPVSGPRLRPITPHVLTPAVTREVQTSVGDPLPGPLPVRGQSTAGKRPATASPGRPGSGRDRPHRPCLQASLSEGSDGGAQTPHRGAPSPRRSGREIRRNRPEGVVEGGGSRNLPGPGAIPPVRQFLRIGPPRLQAAASGIVKSKLRAISSPASSRRANDSPRTS